MARQLTRHDVRFGTIAGVVSEQEYDNLSQSVFGHSHHLVVHRDPLVNQYIVNAGTKLLHDPEFKDLLDKKFADVEISIPGGHPIPKSMSIEESSAALKISEAFVQVKDVPKTPEEIALKNEIYKYFAEHKDDHIRALKDHIGEQDLHVLVDMIWDSLCPPSSAVFIRGFMKSLQHRVKPAVEVDSPQQAWAEICAWFARNPNPHIHGLTPTIRNQNLAVVLHVEEEGWDALAGSLFASHAIRAYLKRFHTFRAGSPVSSPPSTPSPPSIDNNKNLNQKEEKKGRD